MKNRPVSRYTFLIIFLIGACNSPAPTVDSTESETVAAMTDPLPSWNDVNSKQAIISFVSKATEEGSGTYIPKEDRVASFDNDGTLWSENPIYFQLYFAMDRVKKLADENQEWKTQQPFKAVLEGDLATIAASGEHGLLEIVMASHSGMTTDEFSDLVSEWVKTAKHPTKDHLFTEMVYQPMLELIDYLKDNDFKVFIVSGGGIEFMRPWVEEVYGIPKEQVIGSSIKTEFVMEDGEAKINRLPELDFIDDKEGKPVAIWRYVGRKPVFAAGNSDGDLAMLQYATSQPNAFALYVHHTDGEREWAYDRESAIGRLDKGLDEAAANNWTVVDMKSDWKRIFPFDLVKE